MNVVFEYNVIFPDETEKEILFEIDISRGGFEHEFGQEIYPEIDDITFSGDDLTKSEAEFIRKNILDSDDFHEQIWNQYDKVA
jgi:hypothetical protein